MSSRRLPGLDRNTNVATGSSKKSAQSRANIDEAISEIREGTEFEDQSLEEYTAEMHTAQEKRLSKHVKARSGGSTTEQAQALYKGGRRAQSGIQKITKGNRVEGTMEVASGLSTGVGSAVGGSTGAAISQTSRVLDEGAKTVKAIREGNTGEAVEHGVTAVGHGIETYSHYTEATGDTAQELLGRAKVVTTGAKAVGKLAQTAQDIHRGEYANAGQHLGEAIEPTLQTVEAVAQLTNHTALAHQAAQATPYVSLASKGVEVIGDTTQAVSHRSRAEELRTEAQNETQLPVRGLTNGLARREERLAHNATYDAARKLASAANVTLNPEPYSRTAIHATLESDTVTDCLSYFARNVLSYVPLLGVQSTAEIEAEQRREARVQSIQLHQLISQLSVLTRTRGKSREEKIVKAQEIATTLKSLDDKAGGASSPFGRRLRQQLRENNSEYDQYVWNALRG